MKIMKKKVGLLFAIVGMALMFAVSVNAIDLAPTGQCGENVYWHYDKESRELTINGVGEMYGYYIDYSPFIATDIKNIIIEEGVTTIGYKAFTECDYVETVVIPSSLTSIGDYAFQNCRSISKFDVDPNSIHYSSDDYGILFNKDKSILIQCPRYANLSSYTVPSTVTTIKEYAFVFCNNLTSIIIPDSVTTIGESAFYGCKKLESATIGKGVNAISDEAFYYCTNLTDITLSDSVTSIGKNSFSYCDSLTTIVFPENLLRIDAGAFTNCTNIKNIIIPASVTYIEAGAFYNCSSLSYFYVEEDNAQYSNDNQGVLFNKNKDTVIAYPIGSSYTSYVIPNSVTTIESYAFYNNNLDCLTSVTVPVSVNNIEYFAFLDENLKIFYEGNEEQWDEISGVNVGKNFFGEIIFLCEDNSDVTTEPEIPDDPTPDEPETPEEPEVLDTPSDPTDNCSCNCHAGGIKAFFFKILNFFQKLFGKNKICACGAAH